MKKLLLLLLCLTVILCLSGCSTSGSRLVQSQASEATFPTQLQFTQGFGKEDTLKNNTVHGNRVSAFFKSRDVDIAQTNTLTLNDGSTYTLEKSMHSDPETGLNLTYCFSGTYSENGDTLELSAASDGKASIAWGPLQGSFKTEEGNFSSAEDPALLKYFDTAYLGAYNGNQPMTVRLSRESGTFEITSQHSPIDALDLEILDDSPLKGLHIAFLGSSVTHGVSPDDVSFVEIMAARHGFSYTKEAVSGTTLADTGADSYIQRMEKLDAGTQTDLFICQLSTNDASQELPLGQISDAKNIGDFDTATICGAIEYILSYVSNTWHCPVVFYTGTRFSSDLYGQMVDTLYTLQGKWDCLEIIDLWNDEALNSISPELYAVYMHDPIHPTLGGYACWWMPAMEQQLYSIVENRSITPGSKK